MRWILPLALSLLAEGCVGPLGDAGVDGAGSATPPASVVPPAVPAANNASFQLNVAAPTIGFSPRVRVFGDAYAFEPSIEAGPDGTIYVTAHKASFVRDAAAGRLASWLSYSRDGETWQPLSSPAQLQERLYGVEGDIAVDAKGRLYFADTYGADSTLSRWAPGPTWEWTRPVQGTVWLDDRPWLSAHGDSIVYSLGASVRPGGALREIHGPSPTGRTAFSMSEDGGLTWSPGPLFPRTDWCNLAASPADDRTVFVGCLRFREEAGIGGPWESVVFRSRDRGVSWEDVPLKPLEAHPAYVMPAIAVDRAGIAYFVWGDGDPFGGKPTRLEVARLASAGPAEILDATPFNGSFAMLSMAAGRPGSVALTLYATDDVPVGDDSSWTVITLLTTNATDAAPAWHVGVVDSEPIGPSYFPPYDFLQASMGEENRLHVAYVRARSTMDPIERNLSPFAEPPEVFYARQVLGPNLRDDATT